MTVFEWADYLRIARALQSRLDDRSEDFPDEATRRAIVSRAYYAAFGHARRYAVRYLDLASLPSAEEHSRLFDHLRRRGYRKIVERLSDLRSSRNRCDYDDEVRKLETMTAAALDDAAYVIDTLVFY